MNHCPVRSCKAIYLTFCLAFDRSCVDCHYQPNVTSTLLQPDSRALHRVLRRDFDQSKEQELYQFLRLLFRGPVLSLLCTVHLGDASEQTKMSISSGFCCRGRLNAILADDRRSESNTTAVLEVGDKTVFNIQWSCNRFEVQEDVQDQAL